MNPRHPRSVVALSRGCLVLLAGHCVALSAIVLPSHPLDHWIDGVARAAADPAGDPVTLRELAERLGIEIGVNFPGLVQGKAPNNWQASPTIAMEQRITREQFTMASAGWEMYPGHSWKGPRQYDFEGADRFIAWCHQAGLNVHGHGLGYASRVDWLKKMPAGTDAEKQEIKAIYEDYVTRTASHFAGRVQMWDVCNEQLLPAYIFNGYQTGHSYWKAYQQANQGPESGVEWYRQTFRLARASDPGARLILLDFNNEVLCPKSDRMLALVTQLRSEGVPVDGVGFQMHLGTDLNRSKNHGLKDDESYYASLSANLRRFAEADLDLWITELDVRLDPSKDVNAELARQAEIYGRVTEIAASTPRLKGIKFWGILDRDTWGKVIPERPNLFDEDGHPKPACAAVRQALTRVLQARLDQEGEPSSNERPKVSQFQRLDRNGDGKLSAEEVAAPRLFRAADADGDGFISLGEFNAARRQRAQQEPDRVLPSGAPFHETSHRLTIDGRERSYVVQAPKTPRGPLPVVFFFHGGGGDGENMAAVGFRDMVARENFLAVYPTGWKNNWNDGRNAARIAAQQEGVDDIKFIRAIVEDLATRHEIDRGRLFASGVSNGGIFSHYLAAHAADLFAGVAPVIGGLAEPVAPTFHPSHPISLLVIQGDADPLVPIGGGAINNQERGGRVIATEEMLKLYLARNGIEGAPTEEPQPDNDPTDGCRTLVRRYPAGKAGVKVEYWLVQGGGHTMPGNRRPSSAVKERLVGKTSRDFDGLEVIWSFFKSCPPRQLETSPQRGSQP